MLVENFALVYLRVQDADQQGAARTQSSKESSADHPEGSLAEETNTKSF